MNPSDCFFPFTLEQLGQLSSRYSPNFRIIGQGTVGAGEKARQFFVLRAKTGPHFFTLPVFVPETMIRGERLCVQTTGRRVIVKVSFERKRGLLGCPLVPWKSGASFPCRSYAKYEKLNGEWVATESDKVNLLAG